MTAKVLINGIYTSQAVSGQQRFARNLTERLDGELFSVLTPKRQIERAMARHLWSNVVFARKRGALSLSLTHQIPITTPRSDREIVTIHDLFVIEHPEWFKASYAAYARKALLRGIRRADMIFAVSPMVAEQVGSLAASVPVIVIPNAPAGVFSRVGQTPDAVDPHRPPYFLTLGGAESRKRVDLVIRAHSLMERHQRPRLVIVGQPAKLLHQVSLPALADDVSFTGRIDDHSLANLMRDSVAFISASEAEGFGLPIVEAAMTGSQIVCTGLPVHRWILGEQGAEYFQPGDVDALRAALERAATGSCVPRPSGPWNRFSWDDSASLLERSVASLLN